MEVGHTIKDDMLDAAEQVRAHFARLAAMYNDLMKKMMAVNEAREESLKHFIRRLRQWIGNSFEHYSFPFFKDIFILSFILVLLFLGF